MKILFGTGKTLENVRKRADVELLMDEQLLVKRVAKPNMKNFRIFNENLVGVQYQKTSIKLCKPVFAGFTVLEISKLIMAEFYYDLLKANYGDKVHMMMTDTDSFVLFFQEVDPYYMMADFPHMFDLSNYPRDHRMFSDANAKKLGCFKDELGGVPMEECVFLRPKLYSMSYAKKQKNTAKGIARVIIKNKLHHEDYKSALFEETMAYHAANTIRCDGHQLRTQRIVKQSLCSFDDKKHVMQDGINTLAFGHKDIEVLNLLLTT